VPDRGCVSFTPRRGERSIITPTKCLGYRQQDHLAGSRVNPEFVFLFSPDGKLICKPSPEQTYGVLEVRVR